MNLCPWCHKQIVFDHGIDFGYKTGDMAPKPCPYCWQPIAVEVIPYVEYEVAKSCPYWENRQCYHTSFLEESRDTKKRGCHQDVIERPKWCPWDGKSPRVEEEE